MLSLKSDRASQTVLVVDDSPEMRRYLQVLLELDSYRVVTVGSGPEALQKVREGCAPSAVLLDVQMPEMDGLRTLRELRKLRPGIRVIMCSGVQDPAKVQQATALGAEAYLTKPIQHLYLSAALERCMREGPTPRATGTYGADVVAINTSVN